MVDKSEISGAVKRANFKFSWLAYTLGAFSPNKTKRKVTRTIVIKLASKTYFSMNTSLKTE